MQQSIGPWRMTIDSKQDMPEKEWQIEQIINNSATNIQHKTKKKICEQ